MGQAGNYQVFRARLPPVMVALSPDSNPYSSPSSSPCSNSVTLIIALIATLIVALVVALRVALVVALIVALMWEFPSIRGTLIWGPYNKDPTI